MIAFLDIETGGFSKEKNGLCEIALVITNNDLEILRSFEILIKPYYRACGLEMVSYKPEAMEIHGYSIEHLEANGVDIWRAMDQVKEILIDNNIKTIAGHNVKSFDIPWIDHLIARFSGYSLQRFDQLDTYQEAKKKLRNTSLKLPDLCALLGIEVERSHRAGNDAIASLEIYKKLCKLPNYE